MLDCTIARYCIISHELKDATLLGIRTDSPPKSNLIGFILTVIKHQLTVLIVDVTPRACQTDDRTHYAGFLLRSLI